MQEEAWNSNFEFKNLNFESCNGRFGAKITVLHCFALFFDLVSSVEASSAPILRRCFICVIFGLMQEEAWNSNFEFKNLNFESCNGPFWRQNHCFSLFFTVFHCFSTFFSFVEASPAPILRRCFIYVIFEVSNAKGSLKFKFWIQKFEFWAVTVVLAPKCCFALFCTVFRRFLVCGGLPGAHTPQTLHICNIWG